MGLRGPKKLTSKELVARNAQPHRIKVRKQEEHATTRRKTATLHSLPQPTVGPAVPDGLTHARAVTFWQATVAEFRMDTQAQELFRQACLSLQACELAGEELAREGRTWTDSSGRKLLHPATKVELEHKKMFTAICKDLGFLVRE